MARAFAHAFLPQPVISEPISALRYRLEREVSLRRLTRHIH